MSATRDLIQRAFLQHRDTLFTFVLALIQDADAAEDIFQEVGVAILREADKGVDVQRFLPWARTICRRRVADHIRRHQRLRRHEARFIALGDILDQAFEEATITQEDHRDRLWALRGCMQGLGNRARELLMARYQDEADLDQIAQRFGWQANSVKVALAKARRKLGDCIALRLRQVGEG